MGLDRQKVLNGAMPAHAAAKLGDIVFDLIAANNALATKFNALATKFNALLAKLDANHGAAVDHASTLGGAAQVVTIENR